MPGSWTIGNNSWKKYSTTENYTKITFHELKKLLSEQQEMQHLQVVKQKIFLGGDNTKKFNHDCENTTVIKCL